LIVAENTHGILLALALVQLPWEALIKRIFASWQGGVT
jgi:hypothetical protein